ncbi:MAG: hypothetical protein LDL41_20925 [Coleofasciculus sp. S288]|nr:hypothetical protein [Coleofasciculus sp. S288]
MSGNRTVYTGGGNYNERIEGNYIQGNYYTTEQRQALADAAAEIQKLLEQLDKSYSTDTSAGNEALVRETIDQIDSNSELTRRILSALKEGTVSAFEQFLNHPAASFMIAALEDWQKTKRN